MKNQIPQEILDQFEYCERRLKETNGSMTPQQILWELCQNRNDMVNEEDIKQSPPYIQPKENPWRKFLKK